MLREVTGTNGRLTERQFVDDIRNEYVRMVRMSDSAHCTEHSICLYVCMHVLLYTSLRPRDMHFCDTHITYIIFKVHLHRAQM